MITEVVGIQESPQIPPPACLGDLAVQQQQNHDKKKIQYEHLDRGALVIHCLAARIGSNGLRLAWL